MTVRVSQPSIIDVLAQIVAAAAAGCAVWSFWPRVAGALSPRLLRERYAHRMASDTAVVVFDARLRIFEDDEAALRRKLRRLQFAAAALSLAALLVVTGSILNFLGWEH